MYAMSKSRTIAGKYTARPESSRPKIKLPPRNTLRWMTQSTAIQNSTAASKESENHILLTVVIEGKMQMPNELVVETLDDTVVTDCMKVRKILETDTQGVVFTAKRTCHGIYTEIKQATMAILLQTW